MFLSLAFHRCIKLADLREIPYVKNASMLYPSAMRISVTRSVVTTCQEARTLRWERH